MIEYPSPKAVQENQRYYLNRQSVTKVFETAGQHVVRLVVSDMKGAIASKNVVFNVGDYQHSETSSVSGTVFSGHGSIQGARVAFSKADLIEHSISMEGSERDWFLPTGSNSPTVYKIDGETAPQLNFYRGQIHRFYFDDTAAQYGLTFFDQPETEAPRVEIRMKITPMVDDQGDGYTTNPEVNSTETGLHSSYFSKETSTIKELQDLETSGYVLGQQDQEFQITRPFAKSLLADTNITGVRIRPVEADEFGNYIVYGGQGHDRNNPPSVKIMRESLWEDYTNANATAVAYVDGVGTISPSNADNGFLSNRWQVFAQNDPIPNLVIWGTGSEANATVSSSSTSNPSRYYRSIDISNQGIGFEPNATMAVLHYPFIPFAMWTFDRHETLYDDPTYARYSPSPAWNKPLLPNNIIHYWSFDEENGTVLADQPTSGNGTPFSLSTWNANADLSDLNRSTWGIKGRALRLHATDNNATSATGVIPSAYPFTFAAWILPDPEAPISLSFASSPVTSTQSTGMARKYFLKDDEKARTTTLHQWGHLAVVAVDDNNYTLYVDGYTTGAAQSPITKDTDLTINAFNGLIDELYIYDTALTSTEIKVLAGRQYLDLSGNKRHIAPIGNDFNMSTPNMNGSDSNVPVPNNVENGRVGRLGDSFSNEDHGRSVKLDGDDYLDLSHLSSEFSALSAGAVGFWIKTSSTDAVILSGSKSDDNDTYFQILVNANGNLETVLINDGTEVTRYYAQDPINDNAWHHIFLTTSAISQNIWIDGQAKTTQGYAGGSGAQPGFLADVQGMDHLAFGKHLDSNTTSFLNGNLDDIHIYAESNFSQDDVSFLYNLNQGRELVPRLEAVVDAVGTVKLSSSGNGYKEQPTAEFSYGLDGNLTQDLIDTGKSVATRADLNDSLGQSSHGQLRFVEDESLVYSFHFSRPDSDTTWRDDQNNSAWRLYQRAVGTPEMNATQVEKIIWTKQMDTLTQIKLPDDRNVTRKFLEYVEYNGTNAVPSLGLFGYATPPSLKVGGSPTDQNATAYSLFFLDPASDDTANIINPGQGLTSNGLGTDPSSVAHVNGRGFQPKQNQIVGGTDVFGNPITISVPINQDEEHAGQATFNPTLPITLNLASTLKIDGNFGYTNTHFQPKGFLVGKEITPRITSLGGTFFDNPIAMPTLWQNKDILMNLWTRNPDSTTMREFTIFDTILGNSSTRFTQEVRVGDRLSFEQFYTLGTQLQSTASYIVSDVIDDQTIIIRNESSTTISSTQGGLDFFDLQALDANYDYILENLVTIQVTPTNGNLDNPISKSHEFVPSIPLSASGTSVELPFYDPTANNLIDVNQTISHLEIGDSGFGYYMPLEIYTLGASPSRSNLSSWVRNNNLVPNFQIAQMQIAQGMTDVNGSITEGNNSVSVIDGGYGYHTYPQIVITGGGGNGAEANATLGERFILTIGKDAVNIGLLNPNLLRSPTVADLNRSSQYARVYFKQDETITQQIEVTPFVSSATFDGNVTIRFKTGSSVIDLLTELNATTTLFDPELGGGAVLLQGDGTSLLNEVNGSDFLSLHSIRHLSVTQGGRGYQNVVPDNYPKALLVSDSTLSSSEKNASLQLNLGGGHITGIEPCQLCTSIKGTERSRLWDFHDHIYPWIEIWDRNRTENSVAQRAFAVPKIKNGKIEKVIVVDPGNGYVDPVARVHAVSPSHRDHMSSYFYSTGYGHNERVWRCTNLRETKEGKLIPCGHTQVGAFPPEECPGEEDYNGTSTLENWQDSHTSELLVSELLNRCGPNENESNASHTHYNAGFKSRICSGKKANFVLTNNSYRAPYDNWKKWDANLTVVSDRGKISEIRVDYGGDMYIGDEVAVVGSGSGVEAIPLIDNDGLNTGFIFDDPKRKNLATDNIINPTGAGMGFVERPWSWDDANGLESLKIMTGSYDDDNDGNYGPEVKRGPGYEWQYGDFNLSSNGFGDRIETIRIDDFGLFDSARSSFQIKVDYNGTGVSGFKEANITARTTYRLTKMNFDKNATYYDRTPANDQGQWRWRSLFSARPNLYLIDEAGTLIDTVEQNASSFFRANGNGNFLNSTKGRYFDLYVDDRVPDDFYYGFGRGNAYFPAMGGKIEVSDPVPGMSWGKNEPQERNMSVFTDQNGYYVMPNLEPGMYNVAVFLEDKNFQESTFRPISSPEMVSQILYVPGMPNLHLITDNKGMGRSKLEWSVNSRSLSRPLGILNAAERENQANKVLEGIGTGFKQGDQPELIILPGLSNTGFGTPNIVAIANTDGSLNLTILDDENSSTFNPNDEFTVYYSSSISGIDFKEDYSASLSADSSWGGSLNSPNKGQPRLTITPGDGNGTNFVEVPLYSISNKANSDANQTFGATVFDVNGIDLGANLANVQWNLTFDFNDSYETNSSRLAHLSAQTGQDTQVTLFSTMRSGGIIDFKILDSGTKYVNGSSVTLIGAGDGFRGTINTNADGNLTGISIVNKGTGYNGNELVVIEDTLGNGAVLKPIVGGMLTLEANYTTGGGVVLKDKVRILASGRNSLTPREKWLNHYRDSFYPQTDQWWSSDTDGDGLSNNQEFVYSTSPDTNDTDVDGLSDYNETQTFKTNPTLVDTDGDGISDYNETQVLNSDPLLGGAVDSGVAIYGIIYNSTPRSGDLYLGIETGTTFGLPNTRNVSYSLKPSEFPQSFLFKNLQAGLYYRVCAFIDSGVKNGFHDQNEVIAEWTGLLSENKVGANLTFRDNPPDLYFFDAYDDVINLKRGDLYLPSVIALDDIDSNWTGPLLTTNSETPTSIYVSGSALSILTQTSNGFLVNANANYGTYDLSFLAIDSGGLISEPVTRKIELVDDADPVITIQSNPYPWPLGTVWNPTGFFSATDDPDGNITSKVEVTGAVNYLMADDYPISLYVKDDFGRSTTEYVTIRVADLSPPTLHFHKDAASISWLLGVPFQLPENYVTATDNVDGDLSAKIEVTGMNLLDENTESNQTIYFAVTDTAGNRVENQPLTISFEKSAYKIAGVAIDGYLSGSSVEFFPTDPSLNYLSVTGTTDQNGSFDLFFLEEDFSLIDSNGNRIIDPEEGSIFVSGGTDTTTNQPFTSSLVSDANSTVISPLTTILHQLIKVGHSKTNAQGKLADSFGYSTSIDVTNYDPILAAKNGDMNTTAVLRANALVANTLKQVTAITESTNLNANPSDISSKVAEQLSEFVTSGVSLETEMQSSVTLENLIVGSIGKLDPSAVVKSENLSSYTEVLKNSNLLLADSSLQSVTPGVILKELSQKQIAIEEEVLAGYDMFNQGIISLDTLQNYSDLNTLQAIAGEISTVNNFGPEGIDFRTALGKTEFQMGEILEQLIITDADGDLVTVSLVDETDQFDIDGDQLSPFGINSDYQLVVLDASDVEILLSENNALTLTFKLDDNNGKTDFLNGLLTSADNFDNISTDDAIQRMSSPNYYLLDAVLDTGTSWYKSEWFGEFFPGNDGWLYHQNLGWLYIEHSEKSGFWAWDPHFESWWWSTKQDQLFPYFFLHGQDGQNSRWGKFNLNDTGVREYEFFESEQASSSSGPNRTSKELSTQEAGIMDYSNFDAVYNQSTHWYQSSWFGDFYAGSKNWIFHAKLGWLYIEFSEGSGFWAWDPHYNTWWWSTKENNTFPYFFIHFQDFQKSGWGKFDMDNPSTRVYEFFNNEWKIR